MGTYTPPAESGKKGSKSGPGKTYKMADALKKYKGMSESEIREKLSALGFEESK